MVVFFDAFSICLSCDFEKPVVPITSTTLNLAAFTATSTEFLGLVKSIITSEISKISSRRV